MNTAKPALRPPLVLAGFALLLVVVFAASYTLGHAVGPVAPGLRPATGGPGTGHGHGGMPGMDGMDGTSGEDGR
ncbi:hypothetical protein [Kitasatospora sp. NPDC097691]|uniref:hypothetical protein n=1 Tax=Kitasatospora sp. NPDC097691 TaxID=3157231 RepID=UPI003318EE56